MKNYKQLTSELRYQIYGLKQAGLNQTEIADKIGINKGTISWDFRRNKGTPRNHQLLHFELECVLLFLQAQQDSGKVDNYYATCLHVNNNLHVLIFKKDFIK